jgi:hypothetical protein
MIAQLRFNNGYICNSGDDEVLSVECPRCGGFYLHHGRVTVYERAEDAKQTRVTVIDAASLTSRRMQSSLINNPSSRRHGMTIGFSCESCDRGVEGIELAIEQHKGATFIRWRETEASKTVKSLREIAGDDPPESR